ncbi:F0F1 ATP synthase subunit gamma [Nostoc sp. CENA543]|nr:F0F1 ATP synthase subunit gamma [Nostoc sp. CENA543]
MSVWIDGDRQAAITQELLEVVGSAEALGKE